MGQFLVTNVSQVSEFCVSLVRNKWHLLKEIHVDKHCAGINPTLQTGPGPILAHYGESARMYYFVKNDKHFIQ